MCRFRHYSKGAEGVNSASPGQKGVEMSKKIQKKRKTFHQCEEIEYKDAFFRAGIIKNNKKVPRDVIYFEIVSKDAKKSKDDTRLEFTVNEALAFHLALSGTLWAYSTYKMAKKQL